MSIARLDELISHMKEEGQQGESRERLDNDVDGDSSKVEPVTSDTQELDIAEDLSSLSIHPSQESDVGFSSTSDADTVLTTPDATPLSRIDRVLEIEPGSRPETPCPTSHSTDEELDDNAVNPVPYPDAKTMNTPNYKRLTQTIGKLPLMHAIYHHWTARDSMRGRVYIWTHNQHRDIIKIGWSAAAGGSAQRHAQPGNCYAVNTTPVWESPETFLGAYRVERIVHGQLKENNVVQEVACGSPRCATKGTHHREWFRCDPKIAEKQIALWTDLLAAGFYEPVASNGTVGNEADVGDGEMRISAKGQQILNRLCDISPSSVMCGWQSDVPDVVIPVTEGDLQSANDSAAFVDRSNLTLPLVNECVGGSDASSGPEPSRQCLYAGSQGSQSLPSVSLQQPSEMTWEQGDEPSPQRKRVWVKKVWGSMRKSFGRSELKENFHQLIRNMLRSADANSGDGPSLKHNEDIIVRLYASVFVEEFSLKKRQ
ncbi:DNA-binding protein [Apiospora kogelbergensis]|uniref:DNA-binding protein n=1 Tax=Apiospora kogelbergensis TaxID=1337665 RepID=UPI00312F180E